MNTSISQCSKCTDDSNGGTPCPSNLATASGTLKDGDTLIMPSGNVIWGASEMLTINYHIQLIGAGMDKGNFTPDPANATVITDGNTQNGGQLIQTNYPSTGIDFLSRISGIVFELQQAAWPPRRVSCASSREILTIS